MTKHSASHCASISNRGLASIAALLILCAAAVAATDSRQVVVTYHPLATQIGNDILNHGGNAFDAFVAATAAECVIGEGVTSLAGPLGALAYDANRKTCSFLDAGINDALDPRQKWDSANPTAGSAALVPGAIAGLEAISKRYGRMRFSEVLQPATRLADEGFPLSALYAALIASQYGANLKKSAYGAQTYFRDGKPLRTGSILKLPVVDEFLRQIALHGSSYAYTGRWAKECLAEVNGQGGHLLPVDFTNYRVQWQDPLSIQYRGYEIYSPRCQGGLCTLLSLKLLEHRTAAKLGGHLSQPAQALEVMTRIQDNVDNETWLSDYRKLDDRRFVAAQFTPEHLDKMWDQVTLGVAEPAVSTQSTHSYHIVVIDKDGNAITGTNTIESFPWGNGIFVEGIPLTSSGSLPFGSAPGRRRQGPLSMQVGIKNGKLRFASGAFSASLIPASFQFVSNLIDYGYSAEEAVSAPRFGAQAWDMNTLKPAGGRWLDPRIEPTFANALARKGLKFIQSGYIDTGLGSLAVVKEDGTCEGAIAPLSSLGFSYGPSRK